MYREWNWPIKDMYVIGSRAGGTEPSKPFDIRLGDTGFGVFAFLGFDLILVQYFLTLAHSSLQNGNVYSVPFYA